MSGTTENIPHRILFSRIPRDITDLISLLLHFSHCSRHRNMSFRSLFCMHGYEHNKCFPFSNRKVFGSVHWRTLSWTLSWTLMPHTGSDSRKHQLLFSSGQSASRKPCWTVCTAPELSDGRSCCRFCSCLSAGFSWIPGSSTNATASSTAPCWTAPQLLSCGASECGTKSAARRNSLKPGTSSL